MNDTEENPLVTNCAICGERFEAGPDNVIEFGLTACDPEIEPIQFDEDVIEGKDIAELVERGHLDDLAAKEMSEAQVGDMICMGAEHWCDDCIQKEFSQGDED